MLERKGTKEEERGDSLRTVSDIQSLLGLNWQSDVIFLFSFQLFAQQSSTIGCMHNESLKINGHADAGYLQKWEIKIN